MKNSESIKSVVVRRMALSIAICTLLIAFIGTVAACTSNPVSGNKYANTPTPKPYPEQDKYDKVLAEGDGYYLVQKYEETYNSAETKFGIVSSSGEWVLPLSSSTVFNEYLDYAIQYSKTSDVGYRYFATGIFLASLGVDVYQADGTDYGVGNCRGSIKCCFYNVNNSKSFSFNAYEMTEFENGILIFYNSNRYNSPFYSCDINGRVKELPLTHYVPRNKDEGSFPTLSEGLLYYDRHFYNTSGEIMIDLSMYDLVNTRGLHFTNGECTIKFKNPGGTLYSVTIDKQGNFIGEPQKVG